MVRSAKKKVYNTKHRLIRPDVRYWRNSTFKVATNIGTETGLLAMDYGSETTGYIWTII